MRRIDYPDFNIDDILENHSDHFKNLIKNMNSSINIENFFEELKKYLCKQEEQYKNKAEVTMLTEIESSEKYSFLSIKDFKDSYNYIYSNNFEYRKKIINRLLDNRCPLCDSVFGYKMPELDHVLPKSSYFNYIITPVNLIPICSSCNLAKLDKVGNELQGILTPYYNSYPLNALLSFKIMVQDTEVKVNVSLVDFDEFYTIYQSEKKDKNQLYKQYAKIQHHFNLHRIGQTLLMKSNAVYRDMICEISNIDVCSHNDILKYLIELKNNSQEFINELFIRNKMIEAIERTKNKETICEIIYDEVCKIKKNKEAYQNICKDLNV